MQLPTLGEVPVVIGEPLILKATLTGITFCPDRKEEIEALRLNLKPKIFRKFKVRYKGSCTCAVDINGVISMEGKKKAAVKTAAVNVKNADQNYNSSVELPNIQAEKTPRFYKINKRLVRHRLLGYRNTAKGGKELYFWTVSFPENTPDNTAYQALNIWLTALRQYRMLKDYLWIAERQTGERRTDGGATNTIHFHIAIPHKLPVQRANAMMRGTLKTMCRKGLLSYATNSPQIRKYNGVHISKNNKTGKVVNFAAKQGAKLLALYLTKYVTKNDEGFEHLAWHNSRGFSCLFTSVAFSVPEFKRFGFGPFLNYTKRFSMEFAEFIPWLNGPPPALELHLYQLNSYIHEYFDGRKPRTSRTPQTGRR